MSNMIRKIKRNEAEKKSGTRDHNITTKLNKIKSDEKRAENLRKEKELKDKNLGL
jgi:hypothetical protein